MIAIIPIIVGLMLTGAAIGGIKGLGLTLYVIAVLTLYVIAVFY